MDNGCLKSPKENQDSLPNYLITLIINNYLLNYCGIVGRDKGSLGDRPQKPLRKI